MGEFDIVKDDGTAVGLTTKESLHLTELFAKAVQGKLTPEDMQYLETYTRKDPYGGIATQLNVMMAHPEFNAEGEVIDNFHKNAAIRIRLQESRDRSRKDISSSRNIDVRTINKMLALNRPEHGKRFGLGGVQVSDETLDEDVIDVDANVSVSSKEVEKKE